MLNALQEGFFTAMTSLEVVSRRERHQIESKIHGNSPVLSGASFVLKQHQENSVRFNAHFVPVGDRAPVQFWNVFPVEKWMLFKAFPAARNHEGRR